MKSFVLAASLATPSTAAMAQAPHQPQPKLTTEQQLAQAIAHGEALETLLKAERAQAETLATQAYQLSHEVEWLQSQLKAQAPPAAPTAPTPPAPTAPSAPAAPATPVPAPVTAPAAPSPTPPATPTNSTTPAIVAAPVVTQPATN